MAFSTSFTLVILIFASLSPFFPSFPFSFSLAPFSFSLFRSLYFSPSISLPLRRPPPFLPPDSVTVTWQWQGFLLTWHFVYGTCRTLPPLTTSLPTLCSDHHANIYSRSLGVFSMQIHLSLQSDAFTAQTHIFPCTCPLPLPLEEQLLWLCGFFQSSLFYCAWSTCAQRYSTNSWRIHVCLLRSPFCTPFFEVRNSHSSEMIYCKFQKVVKD